MKNSSLKKIAKIIKKAKSIALFTHISPDCDALGSTFAMCYAITSLGKKVSLFAKDAVKPSDKLLFDESIILKECDPNEFDLFISCDVPATHRLGEFEQIFIEKDNKIVLDHHPNSGLIGSFNFVDSTRSSCSEIVLDLLKELKVKITPEIASKIYIGLSSDTNSFVNSNTNEKSFIAAKELINYGADIAKLNEILYSTRTRKSIEFKKYLWNNYKIKNDCAYCLMPYEDLQELKGTKRDCDGYSHSLVTIQGVNYGFSIVEEPKGFFSISMRSKIGYDVRSKAELIGGGGHVCAAGARFYAKNMNEAKKKVLDIMKDS